MNQMIEKQYVGIDVCKAKLDVSSPALPGHQVFHNTSAGRRDLFKALAVLDSPHLVVEPTGGYEKRLLEEASARGVDVSRVNAQRVRSFALASGKLAKTDKVDAGTLCEFGRVFTPVPAIAASEKQRKLSAVARRRDQLSGSLTREKNALEKAADPFVIKDIRASIAFLQRHIASCERELDRIIGADGAMSAKRQRLEAVKGIGPTTSRLLIAELPELGTATDAGICALIGVAPMNNDSGPRRGKRTICGGRSRVRRALYMPMMSAIRYNPILKDFYDGLIARSKPHHVALIAAMRKLVRLLNRMMRDPDFQPASS